MLTETPSIREFFGKGAGLEELARFADQQLISLAMEAEITVSMESYRQIKNHDGKAAVVSVICQKKPSSRDGRLTPYRLSGGVFVAGQGKAFMIVFSRSNTLSLTV